MNFATSFFLLVPVLVAPARVLAQAGRAHEDHGGSCGRISHDALVVHSRFPAASFVEVVAPFHGNFTVWAEDALLFGDWSKLFRDLLSQ